MGRSWVRVSAGRCEACRGSAHGAAGPAWDPAHPLRPGCSRDLSRSPPLVACSTQGPRGPSPRSVTPGRDACGDTRRLPGDTGAQVW